MKFYVAARTTNKEEVTRIFAILRKKGHEITHDWTLHKPSKPYDQNIELAREYSISDMDGIKECDVFVLLTSQESGFGSTTELGAAIFSDIIQGKPKVYIIGDYPSSNLFYYYPSVVYKKTINEVLADFPIVK